MIYDDAPDLYDEHYVGYRDDVPFYLRLADELGDPVLELGAGTGRVTEALARAGHSVVGVDISRPMLGRARDRMAAAGVADRVTLLEFDMRSLDLGARFPLVIAPFNALMHAMTLDDQDAVLRSVTSHMAPGAVFAFDLYAPRFGAMGVLRREAELSGQAQNGAERSDVFVTQELSEAAQVVTTHYFHDRTDPSGAVRRRVTRLVQRYFTRFEVERLCRQAGLRTEAYGGFDRSRLEDRSPVMVFLAKRGP